MKLFYLNSQVQDSFATSGLDEEEDQGAKLDECVCFYWGKKSCPRGFTNNSVPTCILWYSSSKGAEVKYLLT